MAWNSFNEASRLRITKLLALWREADDDAGREVARTEAVHLLQAAEAELKRPTTVAATADALIEILGPACVDRAHAVARTGFNEASRLRITKLLALWREADDDAGREVARTEAVHLLQAAEAELKRQAEAAAATATATANALPLDLLNNRVECARRWMNGFNYTGNLNSKFNRSMDEAIIEAVVAHGCFQRIPWKDLARTPAFKNVTKDQISNRWRIMYCKPSPSLYRQPPRALHFIT